MIDGRTNNNSDKKFLARQARLDIERNMKKACAQGDISKAEYIATRVEEIYKLNRGKNAKKILEETRADEHEYFYGQDEAKRRIIQVGITIYLLTLAIVCIRNLQFVEAISYGANYRGLFIASEATSLVFMLAGMHWWIGAPQNERITAILIAVFSTWMFIGRAVLATNY